MFCYSLDAIVTVVIVITPSTVQHEGLNRIPIYQPNNIKRFHLSLLSSSLSRYPPFCRPAEAKCNVVMCSVSSTALALVLQHGASFRMMWARLCVAPRTNKNIVHHRHCMTLCRRPTMCPGRRVNLNRVISSTRSDMASFEHSHLVHNGHSSIIIKISKFIDHHGFVYILQINSLK